MSQRLTVLDLKNSRLPALVNVCPDDPRLIQWVNSFQERASNQGKFWGSTQLVQFCLSDGCLVLPREVAVIESAKLNGVPMTMGNEWYQFVKPHACLEGGIYGGARCGCCGCGPMTLEDHLTTCSFSKTLGLNKKLRVYPGNVADVGKKIIFQGSDANGIWVRTTIDGVRSDGEQVTLALPFVDTVMTWGPGAPVAVIKDATAYRVLVYELNNDTAIERQIAEYQPSETRPMYRTMKIPGFRKCNTNGCRTTSTLLAIVSLQAIPVVVDNDWLLFKNLNAYQDGIQAVKYWEEGNIAMGDAFFYGTPGPSRNGRGVLRNVSRGGALPTLQAELRKMTGDRTTVRVALDSVNLAGWC